jgi:hypothetical protein
MSPTDRTSGGSLTELLAARRERLPGERSPAPLRRRPFDWLFVAFFTVNLLFVTYIVDLEQVVVPDSHHFRYPVWPPAYFVDMAHRFGDAHDPLLMARPPFWQMTIWIDVLLFGPFYALALYAFVKGRNWIRVPALVWSGMMLSNVLIILMEERYGQYANPDFGFVVAINLPWLLLPLLMIVRMRREPFAARSAA